MLIEDEEKRSDGTRRNRVRSNNARTHQADAPVLAVWLGLDIENLPLMTATRNAGSLVLATCQDPCPSHQPPLRQSRSACLFLCVFACNRCNSSYLAPYTFHQLSSGFYRRRSNVTQVFPGREDLFSIGECSRFRDIVFFEVSFRVITSVLLFSFWFCFVLIDGW